MATPPDFSPGQVLTAAHMDAVGLWLVKSQTVGSAVSTVTVNDAFSTDYDNYVVLYSGGTGSTAAGLNFRIGSSTATYYNVLIYGTYAAVGPSLATTNNNRTGFPWCGQMESTYASLQINVYNPFLAQFTRVDSVMYDGVTNGGLMSGIHRTATSYTSFVIYPDSGTLTGGTIRVYGYRK